MSKSTDQGESGSLNIVIYSCDSHDRPDCDDPACHDEMLGYLDNEAATWNRIFIRVQSEETGYKIALALLRKDAGNAFAINDDRLAGTLRNAADRLEKHPDMKNYKDEAGEAYTMQLAYKEKAERLRETGVHNEGIFNIGK